jgi:tRNA threonylcarbamoyladenosine biosynthesis protein TsaE
MSGGIHVVLVDAEATVDLGRRLAGHVGAGDLVVLSGDLGAGKTTLTRGLGERLQVRGPVTSPTFVIARRHPSEVGGPDLLHVDAYRLTSAAEVDDLDLDLTGAIAVVEWGSGRVEHLSDSRVEILLREDAGGRVAELVCVGPRWDDQAVARLAADIAAAAP